MYGYKKANAMIYIITKGICNKGYQQKSTPEECFKTNRIETTNYIVLGFRL